jgi:rhodanese-related sulfurtransferase
MIYDVRSEEEFATGHLAGAINIPINRLGSSEFVGTQAGFPVTLYCPDEKLAVVATSILKDRGYQSITISDKIAPSSVPPEPVPIPEINAYKH